MSRRSPSCRLGSRRVAVPQTHWRAPSFAKCSLGAALMGLLAHLTRDPDS